MKAVKQLNKTLLSITSLIKLFYRDVIKSYSIWWVVYVPNQLLNILFGLAAWYYYTLFAAKGIIETTYGGDIFSFLIIGMAINPILSTAITYPERLLRFSYQGTHSTGGFRISNWAVYYLAKISRLELLISYYLYSLSESLVNLGLYFIVGVAIFGFRLNPQANYLVALIAFILGYLSCLALGMFVACTYWILLDPGFSVTNPYVWLVSQLPTIFSGVYFPVSVLPASLRVIGDFLPQTYTLSVVRYALLGGKSFSELLPDISKLFIFSLLLPISVVVFKKVEHYMARKKL
ncbi:MAG: ABC transporter permease [Thermoproteota archaeon]